MGRLNKATFVNEIAVLVSHVNYIYFLFKQIKKRKKKAGSFNKTKQWIIILFFFV